MFAQVAVARKLADGADRLTYHVPERLRGVLCVGAPVLVPVGRGDTAVRGYVLSLDAAPPPGVEEAHCRDISDAPAGERLLDGELVDLAVWVSDYYLCPCYFVLEQMLPKLARTRERQMALWSGDSELGRVQLQLLDADTAQLAEWIRRKKKVQVPDLIKAHPQAERLLERLVQAGLVALETDLTPQNKGRLEYRYESTVTPEELEAAQKKLGRAHRQQELLRYLTYMGPADAGTLRGYWPNYDALARALLKKGLIRRSQTRRERFFPESDVFFDAKTIALNGEQQAALQAITSALARRRAKRLLLHGVTGSGKTEVYLRSIRAVLDEGGGAILLVPEISLTPQLIGRFRAALAEPVEVLHSNMSDGERLDAWQRLRRGETHVVVGVRSAVFAPVRGLRLIILDEEHETTFKQSEPDPRYHARDVAWHRMQQNGGVLLLGSATPSVQTYYQLEQEGGVLTLRNRARQQPLPAVEIVDMAQEFRGGNRGIFSAALAEAVRGSLNRGEQVILFLNRRGFSSAIVCRECGYTLHCEKCSIALTYHKEQHLARCHYCDYVAPAPAVCPRCGSRFIRYMGSGTELVEEEVGRLWPDARAERMDLDTTQNKHAHDQILERVARGETQILIGTQMVAKGLDFPNVTTVGVLAADLLLNLPDHTAAERTFQLLTQVAGRAGRGDKAGRVVVQTYNPEHYSIVAAQAHDYQRFYQKELVSRRLLGYPPFCAMVRVLVSDFRPDGLLEALTEAAKEIAARYPDLVLLGPAEAPVRMVRRRFRFHLFLKGASLDRLREAALCGQRLLQLSRKSKTLRILIDVEPLSVL